MAPGDYIGGPRPQGRHGDNITDYPDRRAPVEAIGLDPKHDNGENKLHERVDLGNGQRLHGQRLGHGLEQNRAAENHQVTEYHHYHQPGLDVALVAEHQINRNQQRLVGDRVEKGAEHGFGVEVLGDDAVDGIRQRGNEKDPEGGKGKAFVARMRLTLTHAPGVLSSVTTAIFNVEGNIVDLHIESRGTDSYDMRCDVEVQDLDHFNRMLTALRNLKCIINVERLQG